MILNIRLLESHCLAVAMVYVKYRHGFLARSEMYGTKKRHASFLDMRQNNLENRAQVMFCVAFSD